MRTNRDEFSSSIKPIASRVLLAIALVAAACAPVRATSVAPMDVQTLADHAAQVIIGRVATSETFWSDDHHRIETALRLTDVRYLKGRITNSGDSDSDDGSFRLVIPGGTVGTRHMSICCAPAPRVGQRWMFFLLESYQTFPVVGVYQGAFRIDVDSAGVERVYREDHGRLRGVVGINEDGFLRIERAPASDAHQKLVGARGMRLAANQGENSVAPAMRLADFEAMLEPVLTRSKEYQLTQPAGRFVQPMQAATTLRAARLDSPSLRDIGAVRGADLPAARVNRGADHTGDQP